MTIYKKIVIPAASVVSVGLVCGFCGRVMEDLSEGIQVVTSNYTKVAVRGSALKWMCNICKDQNRYAALDGNQLVCPNNQNITEDQIRKEWNNRVFSEYRRSLWK